MLSEEICFLPISSIVRLIGSGELSSVEVVDCFLKRIDQFDNQLHSYITVTTDIARDAARFADKERAKGRSLGDLHGVPFGLKDMFETKSVLTTAHSRVLQQYVPAQDAQVVQHLHSAGAILLGKHSLHEFAHGGPSFDLPWPPARNPWNTNHYTGSSSTGSAAAVAGGLASFALGTDTGGSVRTPAWMCGVVGFKPSFGLVSRTGVIPFSSSCDHVGPITRTVEDSAIVMQIIAGYDPRDNGSKDQIPVDFRSYLSKGIQGLRIGVLRHHWEEDIKVNPELSRAVDDALAVLRDLGACVEDVRVRSLHQYYAVRIMLTESELFARHQAHLRENAGDYGDHFLGRTLAASLFSSADYISALKEQRVMTDEFNKLHEHYDAFVTVGSGPAPHMNSHRSIGAQQKWSSPSMGTVFSVTGSPALALPCGFSKDGLPLGLQIAGHHFNDALVLQIGHAYEQATKWHLRHPTLTPKVGSLDVDTKHDPPIIVADAQVYAHVEASVRQAGLRLTDHQLSLLLESAPYAMSMARNIFRENY